MKAVTLQQLQQNREQLLAIFQKHHSSNVHVFGSVARGEANEDSDIDFLCEPDYEADLGFFPIELQWELEAYLGRAVDVVTPTILNNKYLGPAIQAEMVAL